jgi:hypothetical protein
VIVLDRLLVHPVVVMVSLLLVPPLCLWGCF